MLARSILLRLSFAALLYPAAAAARQAAQNSDKPAPAGATAATPPGVIRSTTRLVQISVVVHDKQGNPVTNLKKEDFSLFDEGARQEIAYFAVTPPAVAVPAQLLPHNAFTNRYDLKGEDPGAVTVILFDLLNTSVEDQPYVRKQVLRFLQNVKPQDHIAVYCLTTRLVILHEFTQDSSALVEAVKHFTPKEIAAFDASHPVRFQIAALADDPMWARFEDALNNNTGLIADINTINRIGTTVSAIRGIADHLSGVAGRKSLVWVSGGFPIQIGIPSIGGGFISQDQHQTDTTNQLPRPDRESNSYDENARAAADALNRVNMAMYTVDAHGVALNTGSDPGLRNGGFAQTTFALNSEQDSRTTSRLLADRTGGLAFFGNNDINDALHHAQDDGRFAYTISFYPNHGNWDGKFRKIKIESAGSGLQLRYRQGYYASPDRSDPEKTVSIELQQAADSPLDATSLGLIVSGKADGPPSVRKLDLHIGVDPKQLLLQNSDGHRKGALDLFFLQRDDTGKSLEAEKQHLAVNLDEKQYEFLSQAAMVFDRHITVDAETAEIRVLVRDAGSGALGSVTIPAQTFFQPETKPAAPATNP